ncbi:rCG62213 [Rattus norvegicus]|uniref:RCG62213 n=1 Tax=Rattus norvegicus TaxID=10116 RepID=A6HBK0_RAT|nr:rCG62213 [Rattus norvegicus]
MLDHTTGYKQRRGSCGCADLFKGQLVPRSPQSEHCRLSRLCCKSPERGPLCL